MSKIHKTPHQIHKQSKFNKGGNASTEGVTLDIKDLDKYPDEIVQKAIQLKANNQTKNDKGEVVSNLLSDITYLNYAQRFKNRELTIELAMVARSMVNGCPVDGEWAQYTYEEILEMENSGCVIPNEVLAWAHAQQDSDVTSYIIVSENDENTEDLVAEDGKASDNEVALKAKLNQYIVNAEKSIAQTDEQLEVFNDSLKNAKEIKKRKGVFFKEKLKAVEEMNEEWKKLDKKNEEGKLTKFEKIRYKHLSKKIKNSNAQIADEFKSTSSELDEFLNNIDGLNNQVKENNDLSQEIVNTSKNLSKIEKNLSENQRTHSLAGFRAGNGTLAETAFGVDDKDLERVALETVEDIDIIDDTVDKKVSNKKTVKVESFAQEYVEVAEKVESLTNIDESKDDKDVDESVEKQGNTQEDGSETSETVKENASEKNEIKTDISLKFSYKNAMNAASVSRTVRSQLKQHESVTKQEEKELKTAEKISQKNINKVTKEAREAEQKQEANEAKKTILMDQLTAMGEEKAEQIELKIKAKEAKAQQAEAAAQKASDGEVAETENPAKNDGKEIDVKDNTNEQEQAIGEIGKLDEDDGKNSDKLGKSIKESLKANSKKEKLTKSLKAGNSVLDISSKEAKKVGAKTTFVGVGTVYQGVKHTIEGVQQCTTGSALMSSPLTYFEGVITFTKGVLNLVKAALENTNGLDATITGAMLLAESGKADEISQDASQEEKDSKQTLKEDSTELKEASKIAGVENKEKEVSTTKDSQNKDGKEDDSEPKETNVKKEVMEEKQSVELIEPNTVQVNAAEEQEEDAVSANIGTVNVTQQDLNNNIEQANYSAKLVRRSSAVADKSTDESSRASSASLNTSVNNSVETDDKNDRKLTRFNNDSIIESKKRLRRVNAVSASAKK